MMKTLESVLHYGTVSDLEANKLMTAKPHGSRHKPSRLANLISFLARIDGRGEKLEVRYLNFQNAFVLVNHSLLDQKVKAFGMGSKVNSWIAQSP